jgi:hypothetical protein
VSHFGDSLVFDKPVFATYRDTKDRVISGLAEDLYYVTVKKHNLNVVDDLTTHLDLFEEDVRVWLKNPIHPVSSEQCHYARLANYFPENTDLDNVHWVHMNNLNVVHTIIQDTIGVSVKAMPVERIILDTNRPSKEWYWNLLKSNQSVLDWLESYCANQYSPK